MPNTRQKKFEENALYNTHELVLAAQQAYNTRFSQRISVEKIRFLYMTLFELIMTSVSNGQRVDLYKFGTFLLRNTRKGYTIPVVNDMSRTCYVPPTKFVDFRTSTRFKNMLKGQPVEDEVYMMGIDEYEEKKQREAEDAAFEALVPQNIQQQQRGRKKKEEETTTKRKTTRTTTNKKKKK